MENKISIVPRLREFMKNEARSCSMDFGCVTPLYAYRMLGWTVSLNDIEAARPDVRRMMQAWYRKKSGNVN